MEQRLILVRGLSGSGKSTLAKQIVETSKEVKGPIEADNFFTDFSKDPPIYTWKSEFLSDAHNFCHAVTAMHLMTGRTVVVSNTFTTAKELIRYIDLAIKAKVNTVEILEPTTEWAKNPEECLKRNQHRLPLQVILGQQLRWFNLPTGIYDPYQLKDLLET